MLPGNLDLQPGNLDLQGTWACTSQLPHTIPRSTMRFSSQFVVSLIFAVVGVGVFLSYARLRFTRVNLLEQWTGAEALSELGVEPSGFSPTPGAKPELNWLSRLGSTTLYGCEVYRFSCVIRYDDALSRTVVFTFYGIGSKKTIDSGISFSWDGKVSSYPCSVAHSPLNEHYKLSQQGDPIFTKLSCKVPVSELDIWSSQGDKPLWLISGAGGRFAPRFSWKRISEKLRMLIQSTENLKIGESDGVIFNDDHMQ
jgi:hypothetical protein